MNGKLLIPICLFIACQFFYDLFGQYKNTNWSIFYFTCQYISWLVLIILLPKKSGFLNKLPYLIIGAGLVVYIIIEFRGIGLSYDEYRILVSDYKKFILPSAAISALTYYTLKK